MCFNTEVLSSYLKSEGWSIHGAGFFQEEHLNKFVPAGRDSCFMRTFRNTLQASLQVLWDWIVGCLSYRDGLIKIAWNTLESR
jgi:hypothetical protein